MSKRKKKLIIIQLSLLLIASTIIFLTYFNVENSQKNEIISKETEKKIKDLISDKNSNEDIFFNIEYSGLDLAGNRYILKAEEAVNNKDFIEIIHMKSVDAIFYFKDGTILNVKSKKGKYNNKTLDINFYQDVKASYGASKLFAEKAEYSNSKSFLVVSENVLVEDIRGRMFADKLLFDIKNNKLDILASNEKKVNAYMDVKWKKVLEF